MLRIFYTNEKVDNRIFQRLIGWQPSDGWCILDDENKKAEIFLDGRYIERPLLVRDGWMIEKKLRKGKVEDMFNACFGDIGTCIFEKSLPYTISRFLEKTFGNIERIADEEQRQKQQRIVKTSSEIASLQTAIQKTYEIRDWIEQQGDSLIGKTELQLRGEIIAYAMGLGLEGESFDTIVATGANSAIPHHETGKESIQVGPLLIDMGFRWEGMCSDMTRTIWLGEENAMKKEFDAVLSIVQKAQALALQATIPTTHTAELARIAREHIEQAGYGEYYVHSLGHGVGYDVHEAPSVSMRSEDVLSTGMCITLEPGIYLPGKFGVRWENIVILK